MRAALAFACVCTFLACGDSTSTGGGEADADAGSDTVLVDAPSDVPYDGPDSGGGPCASDGGCFNGLSCCGGACVNLANDPLNCGACGVTCSGDTSMCNNGCVKPTCAPACTGSQICCLVNRAGPAPPPACYDGPTCPVGCPFCT